MDTRQSRRVLSLLVTTAPPSVIIGQDERTITPHATASEQSRGSRTGRGGASHRGDHRGRFHPVTESRCSSGRTGAGAAAPVGHRRTDVDRTAPPGHPPEPGPPY